MRDDVEKYSKGPFFNVKPEDVEKISDIMFEEFLNDVFDENSRLDRDKFIDLLSLEKSDYLTPCFLREMVMKTLIREDEHILEMRSVISSVI